MNLEQLILEHKLNIHTINEQIATNEEKMANEQEELMLNKRKRNFNIFFTTLFTFILFFQLNMNLPSVGLGNLIITISSLIFGSITAINAILNNYNMKLSNAFLKKIDRDINTLEQQIAYENKKIERLEQQKEIIRDSNIIPIDKFINSEMINQNKSEHKVKILKIDHSIKS